MTARPRQFSLSTLFAITTVIGIFLAMMLYLPAPVVISVVVLFGLIAASVRWTRRTCEERIFDKDAPLADTLLGTVAGLIIGCVFGCCFSVMIAHNFRWEARGVCMQFSATIGGIAGSVFPRVAVGVVEVLLECLSML